MRYVIIGAGPAGVIAAETLRKAMGKKKAEVMAKMKAKVVDGAWLLRRTRMVKTRAEIDRLAAEFDEVLDLSARL